MLAIAPSDLHSSVPKLEQTAKWRKPPDVRVCYNLPIFRYKIERALMFWRYLGYEFGEITYDDTSEYCTGNRTDGAIVIMPNRRYLGDGKYAIATRYSVERAGKITGARIEIAMMAYGEDLLLEHEIGHALGWTHSPTKGHIMYPYLKQSGTNSDGLRRRRR
jgi:hypothetical protein